RADRRRRAGGLPVAASSADNMRHIPDACLSGVSRRRLVPPFLPDAGFDGSPYAGDIFLRHPFPFYLLERVQQVVGLTGELRIFFAGDDPTSPTGDLTLIRTPVPGEESVIGKQLFD